MSASRLRIPHGWRVEEVPRTDGSRSDMYYFEPGTGKKFRSIPAIYRHLNGEELISHRSTTNRMPSIHDRVIGIRSWIVSGGKLLTLDDETSQSQSQSQSQAIVRYETAPQAPNVLPNGWIVKEFPRKHNNWTDKYYYDPETGRKFRSLVAVARYLTEMEEATNSKRCPKLLENSPQVMNIFEENAQASSSFGCPPEKVNWVLASPEGNAWNPFISHTKVPDSVKQQWTQRFSLYIND